MPQAVKEQKTDYEFDESEYYPCELASVDEKEITFAKKDATGNRTNEMETVTRWEWSFRITQGDKSGLHIRSLTSAEYSTRSDNKIRQWAETLLGRELQVGETLDTDDLLGLPCVVTVRNKPPAPKKDGDGYWYRSDIEEVIPSTGMAGSHNLDAKIPF